VGTAAGAELRVGTAAVKITPPLGIPLAGYYVARGADGVTDDLFAKALVLDDGKSRIALVACDLILVPRDAVVEARKAIEAQAKIPGDRVMVSATHTHTGPVMVRKSPRADLDGSKSEPAQAYAAALPGLIAKSVIEANAKLVPAKVSYARQQENRMSFNRRYWMKDGTVGWNPGKLNPNIVRPAGPIDPEVGVVYLETADGKPLSTYVNFAIHTDNTGGTKLSADMPGALSRALALYKGPDMTTLFANGCCGNINQINVAWGQPQTSVAEANRLGTVLAAAVFKAYMDLKPAADTTLQARSAVLQLPLPKITEEEIRKAEEIVKLGSKAPFMDQVMAYKVLDIRDRQGRPQEAEVQVLTLGKDLAWVSLPGEAFVELGLSIKAASPFAQTHVAELGNGCLGYIPHRSAYLEGNYEVVSARVGEGSGEMLVTAAVRMLEEICRGGQTGK
jgi:hypothetical protein